MPLIREVLLTLATVLLHVMSWGLIAVVAVIVGASFVALIRGEWIDFFGGIMVSMIVVGVSWMMTDVTHLLANYEQEWNEAVAEDKNNKP